LPGLLGLAAKKSSVFERRKGFTGGVHTVLCSLGASKLLGCAEETITRLQSVLWMRFWFDSWGTIALSFD